MFKVLIIAMLAFGFVACDDDDIAERFKGDPIALPVGFFESECGLDGADRTTELLEVKNQTEVVIVKTTYTDTDCLVGASVQPAENITIAVADFSFADKISFFKIVGEDETIAYYISEGVIYMSEAKGQVTEDNLDSSFADFVADPKIQADVVFTPAPDFIK
jgi:hypothetical protein